MIRLRHSLAATGAAVLLGALLVVPAFAWPGFFEGKPKQLGGVDDRAGYYAWDDRRSTPGPPRRAISRLIGSPQIAAIRPKEEN